ncbi:MAG: hypothetical protein ABI970_22000 [Chloroflexota bacterium]
MMQQILLLVALAIIAFVFVGIGLLLRKRSRWLQIGITSSISAAIFLSIAFVGSGIGIGVYRSYQFEDVPLLCRNQTAKCNARREQEQIFDADIPRLTLWMTVPEPFRPPCKTISPEFCLLEQSYDFASYSYLAGAFGAVIVVFAIGQGMRQKFDQEAPLVIPTFPQTHDQK